MNALINQLDLIADEKLKEAIQDLHSRFSLLTDWRTQNIEYRLEDLFSSLLICLLMGDNDIAAIENTIINKKETIESWLGNDYSLGTPSDTTLLRALWNTHPTELLIAASEWGMKWFGKSDSFAIDGKAVRAALEKVCGKKHSPFILNSFYSNGGYFAAQVKIAEKKAELSVVTDLLRMLPMQGVLITTDAFATYAHVIKEVLHLGGNCLIPIKDNQENLGQLTSDFFWRMIEEHPEHIEWYKDEDNGKRQHGRIEYRTTGIITEGVPELVKGTRFEGLITGLAVISRDRNILRRGEAEDIRSNQTLVYLFTDPDATARKIARAARDHWSGSEMVHYVLDTEFDEDASTIRKGYGMENMSLLRKIAYSILQWIRTVLKDKEAFSSFHAVRMVLRDLGGLPELSGKEYRKIVREARRKALEQRKKKVATKGKALEAS